MQIAIFSDTHDELTYTKQALDIAKQRGIQLGFHLGDFCSSPILDLLENSGLQWKGIWGNNDDALVAGHGHHSYKNVDIAPTDFREITLGERAIFITHYPQIARTATLSDRFDAAFHGHNHQAGQEVIGRTLLANPGELCGRRFGKASFGIYDTEKNSFEHVYLLT